MCQLKRVCQLCVSSRALIMENDKLLLVSNDEEMWIPPGGRIESEETLHEGLVREVYEETGLTIKPKELVFIFEFFDTKEGSHKVEVYFRSKIISGELCADWMDIDHSVQFARFFSLKEMGDLKEVQPEFIRNGQWAFQPLDVYKGFAKV